MQHSPHSKSELKKGLDIAFNQVSVYLLTQSDTIFQEPYEGKWSTAEHLGHLILASYPVSSALKQSKFFFRTFGTNSNGSRVYDELYTIYKSLLANGQRADEKSTPKAKDLKSKEKMLSDWKMIQGKLVDRIDLWTESDLDKYRVPHPALGKVTFRELLCFTIFHTNHHLDILKSRGK